MGWSTTAPTLPSGSSWVQKGTTSVENNLQYIATTVYCARLDGKNFAVWVHETRRVYTDSQIYHRCDIGGVTGTLYTGKWTAGNNNYVDYYFTGEADAGVSIAVVIGRKQGDGDDDYLRKTVTFAAPDLLGDILWIKVSGSWKKVSKVYIKVSGAWKSGLAKFKTGGAWK